jgi:cation:H+ antiporter
MSGVYVVAGLAFLFFGGDFLVRGSVALAKRLQVSTLVIGVTIVAFGTSLPELIVSLDAAFAGVPTLALGNVVGSNIANILLVLGLPAIIAPIHSEGGPVLRNSTIMLLVSILLMVTAMSGVIGMIDGIVFVVLLVAFLGTSYRAARSDRSAATKYGEEVDQFAAPSDSPMLLAGFIVGGLAALVIGSELLVDGAVDVAQTLGVSDAVIGLTLVAFGTSLPELVTSLVAIARKHGDVAIGNILGSNLFNILGVMGITAIVVPIPVPRGVLLFDLPIMILAAVILLPFIIRWIDMGRIVGGLFLLAYAAYIWAQFSGLSGLKSAVQ